MPKKRKYSYRLEAWLPNELGKYLEEMVRTGQAESISQAVRRCISLAKTYLGSPSKEKVEKRKGGEG